MSPSTDGPFAVRDATMRDSMTLQPGQRLGDFLITRVVGQGGFGIVYEAEDLTLQRRVAIKEYIPAQLATRIDGTVRVVSSRYAKTFDLGRRSFLAEARLLAQFRHPGLLEVLHFWEQNGTAYMVMPFYEGRTLDQVLAHGSHVVDEAWLKSVIRPVLDALEHMHGDDCYHRDVSADNILIRPDGRALLLDLGAARRVIGESDRALTVMLKPGYAPIEQYADDPACRQGPWTDIYAVAAVLHHAVTNRMPPASASRVMHDSLPSLAALAPPGYSRRFLQAIDRGLSIRPEQRPRTVGEFRSLLFAASPEDGLAAVEPPQRGATLSDPTADAATTSETTLATGAAGSGGDRRRARPSPSWIAGAVAVSLVAAAWFGLGGEDATSAATSDAGIPASAVSRSGPVAGDGRNAADAPTMAVASRPEEVPAIGDKQVTDAPPVQQSETSAISLVVETPDPAGARATTAPVAAAVSSGTVRLAVKPWGEVFVDGASRGITPPLKQLTLAAGVHRIEIRNPAGTSWTKNVDVVAGQRTTVTHRFP
ncbi:MAG: serine/threonine protein kinase [Burkholderiaceae bacterium]|nr:serine/threonine protein kinase [Burkholderiaceae bacterium]